MAGPVFLVTGPLYYIPAVDIMQRRLHTAAHGVFMVLFGWMGHACRLATTAGTLGISRYIFSPSPTPYPHPTPPKNSEEMPHNSPVMARHGVSLWIDDLNKALALFLSYCVQWRVIFDRDISHLYHPCHVVKSLHLINIWHHLDEIYQCLVGTWVAVIWCKDMVPG